jgi:hypothetical protein
MLNVALRRPQSSSQSPNRDTLRAAIAANKAESDRLTALEQGQLRAIDQRRLAYTAMQEAEAALSEARRQDPVDSAYAFVNQEIGDRQDLIQKEALLDRCRKEHDRLTEIETTLQGEITQGQARLRSCQRDVHAAMAEVVTQSPEYLHLLDEIDASWMKLRSLRCAAIQVQTGLRGYLPQEFERRSQAVQPLEERIGYDVDELLIKSWAGALSRLAEDPDARLPG